MGIFSNSKGNNGRVNSKITFIELVSCPRGGKNCEEHRKFINKNILTAREHFADKNFTQSIEELKIAYNKTDELQQTTCIKCAELFRQSITSSLEKIHLDLEKMTQGVFKKKKYQNSYLLATEVLQDFRKKI